MAKVRCSVEETELENDYGNSVPGVVVTCGKCGASAESFGQHEGSIKRCFVLLKEQCDENNFYCSNPSD